MQIRCSQCARSVEVAETGALPERCPHCRGAAAPAALGPFRLERLLAAGGMGEVYLARHQELHTEVAIKLLPPSPPGADATALRERFVREARLTSRIDDPGVVKVLDFAAEGDRLYLVLEFVDGRTLRSRLRDGPLPIRDAVRIARTTATIVAAAHAHGVIHRDLKPENVIEGVDGRIRVLDFGIARALQEDEPITRTGEILGTPEYLAPEQLLDGPEAVDARSDVHALGVLLFELLTGRSPFAGQSLFQALKLVESLVPPPPSQLRAGVPAAVDAVVQRALQKDKEQRWPTVAAFAAALPVDDGEVVPPPTASRSLLWVLAATVAATVLLQLGLRFAAPAPAHSTAPPLRVAPSALSDPPRIARTAAERDLARAWLAEQPSVDVPRATLLLQQGIAALSLGEPVAALHTFAAALPLRNESARERAAVAWHAMHTLLPRLAGLPWLAGGEHSLRAHLLADAKFGDGEPTTPLVQAAAQLAAADAHSAYRTLAAETGPFAAVIRLLALDDLCQDRRAFAAKVQTHCRELPPWPLLAAFLAPIESRPKLLAEAIAAAPPTGPDHALLQLIASTDLTVPADQAFARRRALAEQAWLLGAGPLAPCLLAGLSVVDAARGTLAPELLDRALSFCAASDAAELPAAAVARAMLTAQRGRPLPLDVDLAQRLRGEPWQRCALFVPPDPATTPAMLGVLQLLAAGRAGDAGAALAANPDEFGPEPVRSLLLALAAGDAHAAAVALRADTIWLIQGLALASAARTPFLLAIAEAGVAAGAPSAVVIAVLCAAARAGAEVDAALQTPLFATFRSEPLASALAKELGHDR